MPFPSLLGAFSPSQSTTPSGGLLDLYLGRSPLGQTQSLTGQPMDLSSLFSQLFSTIPATATPQPEWLPISKTATKASILKYIQSVTGGGAVDEKTISAGSNVASAIVSSLIPSYAGEFTLKAHALLAGKEESAGGRLANKGSKPEEQDKAADLLLKAIQHPEINVFDPKKPGLSPSAIALVTIAAEYKNLNDAHYLTPEGKVSKGDANGNYDQGNAIKLLREKGFVEIANQLEKKDVDIVGGLAAAITLTEKGLLSPNQKPLSLQDVWDPAKGGKASNGSTIVKDSAAYQAAVDDYEKNVIREGLFSNRTRAAAIKKGLKDPGLARIPGLTHAVSPPTAPLPGTTGLNPALADPATRQRTDAFFAQMMAWLQEHNKQSSPFSLSPAGSGGDTGEFEDTAA